MFLRESGVIFLFPEQKKRDGGKFILINFFKSLGKNLWEFHFSLTWRNSEGV